MKKFLVALLVLLIFASTASAKTTPIYVLNFDIADSLESENFLYPVYRGVDYRIPIRSSIETLLKIEFSEAEKEIGFISEFSGDHGIVLKEVNLRNGVLKLVFDDPAFFSTGGSARVILLRDQIIRTAMQFGVVEEVVILPEDFFQP